MSRPQPRRSSLSGTSPIAPVPAAEPAPPASVPEPTSAPAAAPQPSMSSTAVEPPAATSPAEKSTRRKYPPKVSFYQDAADTDRIRGAILHTIPYEGVRTLSQFLSAAAMKEVERLEQQYNGGKPFPPVSSGAMPQGRPLGGDAS